ncbi:hypothetical protein [Nocardia suismassiliense]|uniref:hypothetical protein n=1 Tax=Nocardia suismassiliense TaxID=2077092 RepID=UPI00131F45E3|nr:hypothetical protein [Nocardia suismassiliense]
MKSRTLSGLSVIAAISGITATMVGVPAAVAAPPAPSDKLCTMSYPVPAGDFSTPASSDVFATSGNGSLDLQLQTNAGTDIAYEQKFSVVWANIDTGKSGVADTSALVKGPENVLSIPAFETKPGRLALTLSVFNHGEGQNYTNGECSVEYQAQ